LKTWAFVQVFPFQSLAWLTEPLFFNLLRLSLHPWFTVFLPSAAKIREILSRLSEEDEQLVNRHFLLNAGARTGETG
jgi:hypothetical protein